MRFDASALVVRWVLMLAVAVVAVNLLAVLFHFPACFGVLAIVTAWRRMRDRSLSGDAYGSARLATLSELWRHGLLGDGGLILGSCGYMGRPTWRQGVRSLFSRLPSPLACRLFLAAFFGRAWHGMLIRARDAIMVGLFASTGAGKGTSYLIPALLSMRGSAVTLDPQGSIFEATAGHRRKRFGHNIVRLDTSGICGPSGDGLNPLEYIDAKSPDCLDQCRDLASLIVVRTGHEHDPHWNDSAERVLTVFIYFVAVAETNPDRRNLLAVRSIVASMDIYQASLNVMRQMGGMLKTQADSLKSLTDRELGSVLSTVQRHTAWMDSPTVAASLRKSTFNPLELRKNRTTVYLIQSPDRLVTMAGHLRVMIGTMLRVLTRGKASEKNPVWWFIDETAALGRMQLLEDAVTTMRGYGIRLFLVFQSPGQLQKVYGENAGTILDNLGTQIYFAMRSPETGEHISKAIGDMTVDIVTGSDQRGSSWSTGPGTQPQPGSANSSTSVSYSQVARRLFKPEEVRTLPAEMALVFHKNLPVIAAKRVNYYESPLFRSPLTGRTRSGEARGLGLAGAAAACLCLLAALLFSGMVGRILAADAQRQRELADGYHAHPAYRRRYR